MRISNILYRAAKLRIYAGVVYKRCYLTHSLGYPLANHYIILGMTEDADSKAKRRRRIRDSFAPPLNEIALRHVDSVQALSEAQRATLIPVLQKTGLHRLGQCLMAFKNSEVVLSDETDLIKWLERPERSESDAEVVVNETAESNLEDADYLASLLIQCYPDMPLGSAEALVASEIMSASLQVVATTRRALDDAKSDFVITALYTLFEERLNAIKQLINSNPAFVKAIERSRPDWKIIN
jgi:hypothetical protein